MMPTDAERLDAIEARASKATPGPWLVDEGDDEVYMSAIAVTRGPLSDDFGPAFKDGENVIAITLLQSPRYADVGDGKWDENTAFIAHAREDVPWLLARVRELEAERAEAARVERERIVAWLREQSDAELKKMTQISWVRAAEYKHAADELEKTNPEPPR